MNNISVTHFGLGLTPTTRGYNLTRENYAAISRKRSFSNKLYMKALKDNDKKLLKLYSEIFADEEGLIYKDEWCQKKLKEAMLNFDLNMEFFKKLDHSKFEKEITKFLRKTKFQEINDLSKYTCPGYYVLILDNYCQLYIGTSEDIKRRIRQHWSGGNLKLDRLVFGGVNKSKLSIDSFRALDTTRILVYTTKNILTYENNFIDFFSQEFVCNRTGGGIMEFGQLSVLAAMKTRKLD